MSLRVLTLAAVAGLGAAGGALHDSAAAPAIDSPQTLEFAVGRSKDTFVDVGKKGESVGDFFITRGARLRDPATHERVGRIDLLGTIASERAEFVTLTTRLRDGTIQVSGVMRHDESPMLLAVTGGTGSYANARGTLALNASTKRVTFSLLP
jgi:hypothetical protein